MFLLFVAFAASGLAVVIGGVLIARYKQNPEAQLRKRLNEMIQEAEEERAKNPKLKKHKTPENLNDVTDFIERRKPRNVKSFFERVFRPLISSLEERFQKFTPNEIKMQLEDKVFRAGKTGVWNLKRLVTLWCLTIVGGAVMGFLMIQGLEIHPVQKIFIVVLGIFMGAAIPFAILNSQIRQRQKQLRRQLPEFLDLLCVSVQAGLSFDGAVAKMIKRMKGPLIDEFRRAQNDVALGMTHQYALSNLAKRCDLEEIYLFTTSVIQAEKLGTSMTRTLKLQADNMRERHRQYVKGEALKAPVKIIFPMVLFIFPSVFVVLLFPALLQLMRTLGG